jgi:hypothetical protein
MAAEGAALPWGLPTNLNDDPELVKNVPESMKLVVGTARIEVKWILSPDEESDAASDSFVTKVNIQIISNFKIIYSWLLHLPKMLLFKFVLILLSKYLTRLPLNVFALQWWPATISRVSEDGKTDGEGRLAFILRYDPDVEFGYEEPTEHTVSFLSEHELFDFGEVDLLQWRHAGSNWDEVPSWEDAAPEKTADGFDVISMEKVLEKGDRINK